MEKKRYKSYEIPAIGGTQSVNVDSNEETIVLHGTATLTSSYTVAPSGTADYGMTMNVLYVADVTPDGSNVTIFGNTLTDDECSSKMEIRLFYDGTAWQIVKKISNEDLTITVDDIGTGALDGSVLVDGTVTVGKLAMTGEDKILKGDGAGSSEELAIAVNNLATNYGGAMVSRPVAGALTADVSAGAIEFSLVDNIVSMANMADITRGSIIRGGVGNAPELHDAKTDGYIPAGTGTDVKSLEVGGDASAEYDPVNDKLKFTVSGITAENELSTTSTVSGYAKTYIWSDLAGSGLLDGDPHTIYTASEGDVIVRSSLYVKTAASGGTVDVDALFGVGGTEVMHSAVNLTITGEDTYDLNQQGYFNFVLDGSITIQSNSAVTDGMSVLIVEILRV